MNNRQLRAEESPSTFSRCESGVRLEVVGWGFTRRSSWSAAGASTQHRIRRADRLWIDLQSNAHAAPVVNLLVESGAQVEQVLRRTSLESGSP